MKRVSWLEGDGETTSPLATFSMKGGQLEIIWHSAGFRRELEREGLRAPTPEGLVMLSLEDGQVLYDALELAYETSSRVIVETLPDSADRSPV